MARNTVPMPRRRPLPGDVNEAGGNPMQRMPRNPRMDSADVPRRPRDPSKAMGIPRNVIRDTAIEARKMREEAVDEGDVIININEKKMAHGGYVCPPNQRKGNIDMRKDKGMVRSVKDNRKK